MSPTFRDNDMVGREELVELYDSVGWTVYSGAPDVLEKAVARSTFVVTARQDGGLVGLARVVSDDATIAYVQDILVVPAAQGQGIGRGLLGRCLERFAHVRQRVLLTDDRVEQHGFYSSLGFEDTRSAYGGRLHAFVNFAD